MSYFWPIYPQLYDTLIVFGDEVDFIWLQRWSLGKWVYILTRYWAFFDVIVLLWCKDHCVLDDYIFH